MVRLIQITVFLIATFSIYGRAESEYDFDEYITVEINLRYINSNGYLTIFITDARESELREIIIEAKPGSQKARLVTIISQGLSVMNPPFGEVDCFSKCDTVTYYPARKGGFDGAMNNYLFERLVDKRVYDLFLLSNSLVKFVRKNKGKVSYSRFKSRIIKSFDELFVLDLYIKVRQKIK